MGAIETRVWNCIASRTVFIGEVIVGGDFLVTIFTIGHQNGYNMYLTHALNTVDTL